MNPQALLTFEKLAIKRDGQLVLTMDYLELVQGETLVIIGPNGAGKSTLLLTAAGLLPPVSGSLSFGGIDVYSNKLLNYRRKIALVLQDPLLQDTSVFDNVAAGLRFRNVPKKEIQPRVASWMKRLNIEHLGNRRARSLSGGEAQRTSLARALVLEPDLLLLDEPFSSLDAPTRLRLLEDFHKLVKENPVTALLVTHDLNEALQLGDRVAVMIDGQLRQTGTPTQVFNAPNDPDIAAFVGVDTVIDALVIDVNEGLLNLKAKDFILQAVGDIAPGRKVLLCLRPEDITLWKDGDVPLSSARNRIYGTVQRCHLQGVLVRVVVDCGFPVTALITSSSWLEMGIKEGSPVSLSFKASAGHVLPR